MPEANTGRQHLGGECGIWTALDSQALQRHQMLDAILARTYADELASAPVSG